MKEKLYHELVKTGQVLKAVHRESSVNVRLCGKHPTETTVESLPRAVSKGFTAVTHLTLPITPRGRYFYRPHYTDVRSEAERGRVSWQH